MHERIAVHPISFPGLTALQYLEQCRALDVHRVGFLSPALLDDAVLVELQAALSAGDVAVETITHLFCQGQLSSDKSRWHQLRDTLSRVIERAASIKARSIYMLTGGHGSESWEADADCFCAAIAPCVEEARRAGVALAVENASSLYADLHIAHSLADTVKLAEMADMEICIELFFCWAEAGLPDLFDRAVPRCALVQVSDYIPGDRVLPDRSVPGDGVVPLDHLVGLLLDRGYTGAFDLEVMGPRIEAEGAPAALARGGRVLGDVLTRLGA